MPSLLLTIFLLQLALHIINTVGAQSLNDLLWSLYTSLPFSPSSSSSTSTSAKEASTLRKEILTLQRELATTSAQDNFASWAKIRRKLDKATARHDLLTASSTAARSAFDTRLNYARKIGINGLRFFLQWYYRASPMFWLPKGWAPYYAEWILSWPKAPIGAVSVQIWGIACASVITLVGEAGMAGWLLAVGKTSNGNKGQTQAQTRTREQKSAGKGQ